MFITVDGKAVTLTDWQLEKAYREYQQLVLEEKARAMLDDYISKSINRDPITVARLHPFAIHAPWHVDYLADLVAQRFLCSRKDTATDATTWKQAIEKELAAQRKTFDRQYPAGSRDDEWLPRPMDTLLRLIQRNRRTMEEVVFRLDETLDEEPNLCYRVSFYYSEGLLYVQVKGTASCLVHLLDNGTEQPEDPAVFAKALREFLAEDLRPVGRRLGKLLWVRQFNT